MVRIFTQRGARMHCHLIRRRFLARMEVCRMGAAMRGNRFDFFTIDGGS